MSTQHTPAPIKFDERHHVERSAGKPWRSRKARRFP